VLAVRGLRSFHAGAGFKNDLRVAVVGSGRGPSGPCLACPGGLRLSLDKGHPVIPQERWPVYIERKLRHAPRDPWLWGQSSALQIRSR